MPAAVFSFTAPTVSEEEERAELESFTPKEKHQLERDLFGSNTTASTEDDDEAVVETEETIQTGVALLQESLAQIPDNEKVDYLEALELAPELVERESPSIAFLRCENYNAWAAARRLVEYWKFRRGLFGDRAFLPMTLDGALRPDLENLQQGVMMPLPCDKNGRIITFLDRVMAEHVIQDRAAICRCAFYIVQAVSESDLAQKNGWVSITGAKGFDFYKNYDRKYWRQMVTLLRTMPLPYRAGHLCALPGNGVTRLLALPLLKFLLGRRFRHRFLFHSGDDEELVRQLSLYGLKASNLPTAIGGGYTRDKFDAWLQERQTIERERAAALAQVAEDGEVP